MTPQAFEAQLRNLDQIATLVRRRAERETWRFEFSGKPYYLHFFPGEQKLKTSGAPREFAGLKTLQDFKIPAVRVSAMMSGFRFGGRKGGAIITHGLEPAQRLDDALVSGLSSGLRYRLLTQLIEILSKLAAHDVGHESLALSSFIVHEEKLSVLDAIGITSGGLTQEHLMRLAHRAETHLSAADRVRVWRALFPDTNPPRDRRRLKRYKRDLRADAVEPIVIDDWRGKFRARSIEPLAFSAAARLSITADDWKREWGLLLKRVEADQLDILKRDPSGDVLAGEIALQGRPISVIVKRPRNKYLYRTVLAAFRMSRARRLWEKTRWLQVRHIPVEYPLAYFEKPRLGYAADSIAIFERVPGVTLDHADLDAIPNRESFFRACGKLLRKIEDTGLTHTDAKSSNWIVFTQHAARGAQPVLIDAYGIRALNAFLQLFGIRRLLRAMKQHPQYTPEDSRHLCQGFAPRATLEAEP